MANQVNIDVSQLASVVHSMVQYNIDENIEALNENIGAAGEAAKDYLQLYSIDGIALKVITGMSERTGGSLSHDYGMYREGWTNYHYKPRKEQVSAVVANATAPSLTHLLEDGFTDRGGTRHGGNKKIAEAYELAAPIAAGGMT